MKKLLVVTLLSGVVLTSGCAQKLLRPDDVSASTLSNGNAILIGSFARNPKERAYYSQTFLFRNTETGETREIQSQQTFNPLSGGKTKDDFETPTSVGGLFVYSVPSGKYAFNNFRLFQSTGSSHRTWSAKEDYSIPFEVKPGAVNYVGEIRLEQMTGKNIFGMKILSGGVWFISDQRARDLGIAKTLYPDLPLDKVEVVIPDRKDRFTPLVLLPAEQSEIQKADTGK